ncbi:hypothetical protein ACHAWF_000701 [Thalassiosira exigua]
MHWHFFRDGLQGVQFQLGGLLQGHVSLSRGSGGGNGDDNIDRYGECGLERFACRDSIKCQPGLAWAIGETCAIEEDEAEVDFDGDAFVRRDAIPSGPVRFVGRQLG